MPDGDGYPTDEELQIIDDWPEIGGLGDGAPDTSEECWHNLFDYIKSLWWCEDWGWKETDRCPEQLRLFEESNTSEVKINKTRWISMSTGGWSGNETLISHMQEKFIFWSQTWINHRRGGHYVFCVPKLESSPGSGESDSTISTTPP